jgi:hypothetical protein
MIDILKALQNNDVIQSITYKAATSLAESLSAMLHRHKFVAPSQYESVNMIITIHSKSSISFPFDQKKKQKKNKKTRA